MKRFKFLSIIASLFFVCCGDLGENQLPSVPQINEYTLQLLDKNDFPIGGAQIGVYSPSKADFEITSQNTDIFGNARLINLNQDSYVLVVSKNDVEIGRQTITINEDDKANVGKVNIADYEVPLTSITCTLVSDRGAAIVGRKVDLYVKNTSILYKSAESDENGLITFADVPLLDYTVNIATEDNEGVFQSQDITATTDAMANNVDVTIVKYIHNSDIVITGMMVDPKGYNDRPLGTTTGGSGDYLFTHEGGYQYIQLMALKDIDFSATPYTVITCNNATKPTDGSYPSSDKGWVSSLNAASFTTYQMTLETGSVKKGQFFYVGGYSYQIAGYYIDSGKGESYLGEKVSASKWWAFDYYGQDGANSNGKAKKGKGIFNVISSGVNVPDGAAVFEGTSIDENSIPQDVIFYGHSTETAGLIRQTDFYNICDNDHYSTIDREGQPQRYFGKGTNTFFADMTTKFNDNGCYIRMGGVVNEQEWLTPRTCEAIELNRKSMPNVDESYIETGSGVTQFVEVK